MEIPERSSLVLVDCQQGFMGPRLPARFAPALDRLITDHSSAFERIIATRFTNPADSPFRRFMGWSDMAGSPQTDLAENVAATASVVLDKTTYGCADKIQTVHPDGPIFVAGVDTEVCVLVTATGLFDLGRDVCVITDVCASNGGEASHGAGVLALQRIVGRSHLVMST